MTTSRVPAPDRFGRGSICMHLDRGQHPATRVPLLDSDLDNPSAVCGGCANKVLKQLPAGGERLKCGLLPRGSRGLRGPDLRDSMPACVKYAAASGASPTT
ncbi:hypothetical protein [Streptomyces lavendulae]|uniref:hypothetical protein n=1 Tax=Streptomyces lavendulae TaxID=1914 RepID=UPI0024A27617|nr:hypothetical protein [Streptomyces lavendulae]GLX22594.1 hypothetical protein Slala01_62380 [Streptomyces lavendulae subsp. lavendulae]GLX30077.1 hypothetical protein Slala02_58970 [Streptomyces lavendulae subsp. lavendulae]